MAATALLRIAWIGLLVGVAAALWEFYVVFGVVMVANFFVVTYAIRRLAGVHRRDPPTLARERQVLMRILLLTAAAVALEAVIRLATK